MKALLMVLAVLMLAGCNVGERLDDGAKQEKKANARNGKVVNPPPVPLGVSEEMILVDGKWELAKNVEVRCVNGHCKPVLKR